MTVGSIVGTSRVPESMRALSSLSRVDYVDQFTLSVAVDATPERWARALFGDVPSAGEWFIWRGVLGLRLSPERSPWTIGGWRVNGRGENWIRLETASWFLTGNLIVRTTADAVSWATFLRYDRGIGHVVWPPLSAIHRRLVPGVLRAASARIRSRA
jgi:hypothetical protein